MTTLPADQRSLVLRVVSASCGKPVEITRATAAETVVAEGRIHGSISTATVWVSRSISRAFPGERAADDAYYHVACRAIDEMMDNKVHDAIKSGDVRTSCFPLPRLPLLVYLGSKLEDNYSIDVYQRHRATQAWTWDPTAPASTFAAAYPSASDAVEAVLVLNVSGTVSAVELPDDVVNLPRTSSSPT